jgi:hypothetical protein
MSNNLLASTDIQSYYIPSTEALFNVNTTETWSRLYYLLKVKVRVFNDKLVSLSDIWKFRAFTGKSINEYTNAREMNLDINLLDNDRLGYISELINGNIGIRFIPSNIKKDIIVDIVRYEEGKTEAKENVALLARFINHQDKCFSLSGFNEIMSYIQKNHEVTEKILGFYLN